MNDKDSRKVTDYIIRVIDIIIDGKYAFQQINNSAKLMYEVGFINYDEDEFESELIIHDVCGGVAFKFTPEMKELFYSSEFTKDDYFNLSLTKDLVLCYDDLNRILKYFCSVNNSITIRIPNVIITEILEGTIDEHSIISK